MKEYNILQDFKGSQTGHDHHQFHAGTVAELSDSLAEVALKAGYVCEIEAAADETAMSADETKAKSGAPANKAIAAAPSNKSKKAE